jgi:hypothetical protein
VVKRGVENTPFAMAVIVIAYLVDIYLFTVLFQKVEHSVNRKAYRYRNGYLIS